MFVALSRVSCGYCDVPFAVITICCLQAYLLVVRALHPRPNSECLSWACKVKPSAIRGQAICRECWPYLAAIALQRFVQLYLGGHSIVVCGLVVNPLEDPWKKVESFASLWKVVCGFDSARCNFFP